MHARRAPRLKGIPGAAALGILMAQSAAAAAGDGASDMARVWHMAEAAGMPEAALRACLEATPGAEPATARLAVLGWRQALPGTLTQREIAAIALFDPVRNLRCVPGPIRRPAELWRARMQLALANARALARRSDPGSRIFRAPSDGALLWMRTSPPPAPGRECALILSGPEALALAARLGLAHPPSEAAALHLLAPPASAESRPAAPRRLAAWTLDPARLRAHLGDAVPDASLILNLSVHFPPNG